MTVLQVHQDCTSDHMTSAKAKAKDELQVYMLTVPGRWYNRFSISSIFITELFSFRIIKLVGIWM